MIPIDVTFDQKNVIEYTKKGYTQVEIDEILGKSRGWANSKSFAIRQKISSHMEITREQHLLKIINSGKFEFLLKVKRLTTLEKPVIIENEFYISEGMVSKTEAIILKKICAGETIDAISVSLNIATTTISGLTDRIVKKTGAGSKKQLLISIRKKQLIFSEDFRYFKRIEKFTPFLNLEKERVSLFKFGDNIQDKDITTFFAKLIEFAKENDATLECWGKEEIVMQKLQQRKMPKD